MHPDVQTMAALARIDQHLRDAHEARLVARARAARRRQRRRHDSPEVGV